MFGPIGGPEMVVILIIALLVFGPRRLPDLARSLGKGLSELRRTSMDMRRTLEREIHMEDAKDSPGRRAVAEDPEAAVASSMAGPAGAAPALSKPAAAGEPTEAEAPSAPGEPGPPTPKA